MKKFIIASALLVGGLTFVGCVDDRESNPTYHEPTEFVLNTPKYANGTYDLADTESILLTCSQADYGFSAAATYTVEVSVNEDFSDSTALTTTYKTARMEVDAKEIAVAIVPLMGVTASEDFPTESFPLYIRLKSSVTGATNSEIYSNIITLPNVKSYFALDDMELPTEMYIIGDFCGWDWTNAYQMVAVNSHTELFWTMCHIEAGQSIKFNTATAWDGGQFGVADNVTIQGADYETNDDGNIVLKEAGWHLIMMTVEIDGRDYKYTIDFFEPNVYVYGATIGEIWASDANWLFAVPETADGEFVSPALTASGELRLCVNLPNCDWWQSEFIFFDGIIAYRGADGDQERVTASAGQKVYLNFSTGEGRCE